MLFKSLHLFTGLCEVSRRAQSRPLGQLCQKFFGDYAEKLARHESPRGLARWCSALCHAHSVERERLEDCLAELLACRPRLLEELEREGSGLAQRVASLLDWTLRRGRSGGWRGVDGFDSRGSARDCHRDPLLDRGDSLLYLHDHGARSSSALDRCCDARDGYYGTARHPLASSSSSSYAVADVKDRYLRRLEEDRTYHEVEAERDRRQILQVASHGDRSLFKR